MIKKVICQYCGKEFLENDYEYDDYIPECEIHEMSHLNLKEKFEINLQQALNRLDQKYNCKSHYQNCSVDLYRNYNYDDEITYDCDFSSDKFETIHLQIKVDYEQLENVPTTETIISDIEKYYIAEIKKEYIGIVEYEDWCGGDGADDYVLDGQYMGDIFRELKGKKVLIKVLDGEDSND